MTYAKWTDADFEAIKQLTELGQTAREIAQVLNRSENSIKHYKVKLGLSRRSGNNSTDYSKYQDSLAKLNVSLHKPAGIKGNSTFKCLKCGLEWKSRLWDLVVREQGCPTCTGTTQASKIANKWLDSLNIETREYKIPGTKFTADGYCAKTNTIYEFLGDFWHGNLDLYNADDINPKTGCSYEELFLKTCERFRVLESLGYNICYIWEHDYLNQ